MITVIIPTEEQHRQATEDLARVNAAFTELRPVLDRLAANPALGGDGERAVDFALAQVRYYTERATAELAERTPEKMRRVAIVQAEREADTLYDAWAKAQDTVKRGRGRAKAEAATLEPQLHQRWVDARARLSALTGK